MTPPPIMVIYSYHSIGVKTLSALYRHLVLWVESDVCRKLSDISVTGYVLLCHLSVNPVSPSFLCYRIFASFCDIQSKIEQGVFLPTRFK